MPEKYGIKLEQAQVLVDLEKLIGRTIPQVKKIQEKTRLGVQVEDDIIIGLGLYTQYLTTLPESIGNLSLLEELNLRWNKLTTLPESIANLSSLQKLYLDRNSLTTLPESITKLESLQELTLTWNQLNTLPESIGNISSLKKLDLTNNQLKTLPKSIGNLKSLKNLNLSYNDLTTLPESITNLSSLQKLYLGNNKFSTLPEPMTKLESLQILNLDGNKFTTLPESITKLEFLQELNLRWNKLKTLPESIAKLSSLQKLYLGNNKFSTLPEPITKLESLQNLNLTFNNLSTLPYSLWRCKNLKSLELNINPWKDEWKEIAKYDGPAVLKYCRGKMPIIIFISHSKDDKKKYSVSNLKKRLKRQKEILEVYSSGENDVSVSHLLIFIATNNSITDTQSRHELSLALTHGIGIIPIKGSDIKFEDLKQIDLRVEDHGYFDLSDKLGFEFDSENKKVEEFCDELYEYIKQYKRDFNLFDVEARKLNAERENVKTIIEELIESVEFRDNLMENFTQLKAISEELRTKQIYPVEYILRWIQILNSKSK